MSKEDPSHTYLFFKVTLDQFVHFIEDQEPHHMAGQDALLDERLHATRGADHDVAPVFEVLLSTEDVIHKAHQHNVHAH